MRQVLKVGAFVAFLAVDVALIVFMIRHVDADSPDVSSRITPAPSSEPTLEPTGEVALARGSGVLVRSRSGSCSDTGRPLMEKSRSGKDFDEIALPLLEKADDSEPGSKAVTVRTVLRVEAKSADELSVIAGDKDCKPTRFTSEDGGTSWERQKELDSWFVDAAGEGVVSPSTSTRLGCDVESLWPFSDLEANVVCSAGTILATADGGASWATRGQLDDLVTGTFTSPRQGFAFSRSSDCVRAYSTNDGGVTWQPQGCLGDPKMKLSALTGNLSELVASDSSRVRVSTDRGKSWKAP